MQFLFRSAGVATDAVWLAFAGPVWAQGPKAQRPPDSGLGLRDRSPVTHARSELVERFVADFCAANAGLDPA
jgi:hypothetical protein